MTRPTTLTLVLVLSIVAAVCWLLVISNLSGGAEPGSNASMTGTMLLLVDIVYVVFAVQAWRGRPWTRLGLPLVSLVLYFFLLPWIWLGLRGEFGLYGDVYAYIDLVGLAASLAALGMLFSPQSAEYFRARQD